jgi:hypothetical protein
MKSNTSLFITCLGAAAISLLLSEWLSKHSKPVVPVGTNVVATWAWQPTSTNDFEIIEYAGPYGLQYGFRVRNLGNYIVPCCRSCEEVQYQIRFERRAGFSTNNNGFYHEQAALRQQDWKVSDCPLPPLDSATNTLLGYNSFYSMRYNPDRSFGADGEVLMVLTNVPVIQWNSEIWPVVNLTSNQMAVLTNEFQDNVFFYETITIRGRTPPREFRR